MGVAPLTFFLKSENGRKLAAILFFSETFFFAAATHKQMKTVRPGAKGEALSRCQANLGHVQRLNGAFHLENGRVDFAAD